MDKKFKMLPPTMPNFIAMEIPDSNAYGKKPAISITQLTKEEAEQYGELMKQSFINHWEKKKRG